MTTLELIPEEPLVATGVPVSPTSPVSETSFSALSGRALNFSRPRPFSPPSSNPASALAPPTLDSSPATEHTFRPRYHLEDARRGPPHQEGAQLRARTQTRLGTQANSRPESRTRTGDEDGRAYREAMRERGVGHVQEARDGPRRGGEEQAVSEVEETDEDEDEDEDEDDDDDDAAPFPVIRTYSDKNEQPHHLHSRAPQTWIYKPYADSVVSDHDSDADSTLSGETVTTTTETDSIAESTDTGYSEASSEFAFDGRLGWNPVQRPSQAERERQRWAAPVVRSPRDERDSSDSERTSWLGNSSDNSNNSSNSNNHTSSSAAERDRNGSRPEKRTTSTAKHPRPLVGAASATSTTNHKVLSSASRKPSSYDLPGPLSSSRTAAPLGHPSTDSTALTTSWLQNADLSRRNSAHSIDSVIHEPVPQQQQQQQQQRPRRQQQQQQQQQHRPSNATSVRPGSLSSDDWRGSEIDVSELGPEKIRKLEKKGVNPALYLEMKRAREGGLRNTGKEGDQKGTGGGGGGGGGDGGKKPRFRLGMVGVLTGNSFLS